MDGAALGAATHDRFASGAAGVQLESFRVASGRRWPVIIQRWAAHLHAEHDMAERARMFSERAFMRPPLSDATAGDVKITSRARERVFTHPRRHAALGTERRFIEIVASTAAGDCLRNGMRRAGLEKSNP